jgi:phytoene dehydrogenase-like protein
MGEIDGAFRSWGISRGGTGAISNAIADAAREAGAEIRTEAPIEKIVLKNGRSERRRSEKTATRFTRRSFRPASIRASRL